MSSSNKNKAKKRIIYVSSPFSSVVIHTVIVYEGDKRGEEGRKGCWYSPIGQMINQKYFTYDDLEEDTTVLFSKVGISRLSCTSSNE